MAIDVRKHKKKFLDQKPSINLVPFIDILFTIMIFLVVTSNFSATDVQADTADDLDQGTGKPNVTDVSGDQEYYVVPVANLHKVTVNGQDRSDAIAGSAVGVQARVIDEGQVIIKPGEIVIETPPGISVDQAVQRPEV
ncbi:MAG: biopolymer transporter ExbD [Methanobrevibacter sp.]|jgi:biopolymer transport protein ExbD|uniref:Biopolymer transport protein ExbD/TolR n=1 Tax=Methanobrevibacter thaueri TaxID=190975 RepID=A0A315XKY3_9EURY|nr:MULTISPECIES: biopolymer transporter ExbD [Methanobrevibacter]MBR2666342.1 biopolymer transporter ExbD [Methanobrevibacter sp.]MBR7050292.1 biopolymer transporter ExbD [Methanobrevibacter sp.]PWB86434.1 biopolymer transport protein ExbD/TolR [Methanobrevibacter thaueri]